MIYEYACLLFMPCLATRTVSPNNLSNPALHVYYNTSSLSSPPCIPFLSDRLFVILGYHLNQPLGFKEGLVKQPCQHAHTRKRARARHVYAQVCIIHLLKHRGFFNIRDTWSHFEAFSGSCMGRRVGGEEEGR